MTRARRSVALGTVALAAAVAPVGAAAAERERGGSTWFVSAGGGPHADGTRSDPFASLRRAERAPRR